jgi:hypothetical protein
MPSKENYCYRILKKYSLIVDFEGIPIRKIVPEPIDGETYGRWKERVLGSSVNNVVLYAPTEPANNKRISTLQNQAGAEHLEKVFQAFGRAKEKQKKSAVRDAVKNTEKKFTSFSKDTLEDLISEAGENLEPSVREFFDRFLNSVSPDIDTEKLISELLRSYNGAVRKYRELS